MIVISILASATGYGVLAYLLIGILFSTYAWLSSGSKLYWDVFVFGVILWPAAIIMSFESIDERTRT